MGDAHLGSGTRYERESGDRLRDHAALLQVIAQTAIEHDVQAVLNAGDTFDGPSVSPAQEQVFADFVATCRDAGIPVLTLLGNGSHDLAQKPVTALEIFRHIEGVEIFTQPAVRMVGETAVCMLPWTPVSRLIAARGGGDRDDNYALGAQLLIEVARELRAQVESPCVLMLHFAVEGAALPNGLPVEEKAREPILPLAELEALGFDAVVAGHIHRAQRFDTNDVGSVGSSRFYTGSPMCLNFGEANIEHGVWLLTVDEQGATSDFLPLPSRPFVTIDVHVDALISGAFDQTGDVVDGRVVDAIARARYTATEEQARRIDHAEITRVLLDAGAHKVFILPEIVRADRARVAGVDEDLEPLAALAMWVDANEVRQGALLAELTRGYLEAVA